MTRMTRNHRSPDGVPTLLVFTRGPAAERRHRRLLPGRLSALERRLYAGCLEAAVEAGVETGCRVEISSPRRVALPGASRGAFAPRIVRQDGGDFGSRLSRALQLAESRTAAPLVVVGTDVPGLTGRHVREALDALAEKEDRAVIGPSPDGGIYLLAASRPISHLLARVAWCRPETRRSLVERLETAGFEVTELAPLADLDRASDLVSWLATPQRRAARVCRRWWAAIRRRLSEPRRFEARPRLLAAPEPDRTPRLGRAPPAVA